MTAQVRPARQPDPPRPAIGCKILLVPHESPIEAHFPVQSPRLIVVFSSSRKTLLIFGEKGCQRSAPQGQEIWHSCRDNYSEDPLCQPGRLPGPHLQRGTHIIIHTGPEKKFRAALNGRRDIIGQEAIGGYCGGTYQRCAMVESEWLVEGGLCNKTTIDQLWRRPKLLV